MPFQSPSDGVLRGTIPLIAHRGLQVTCVGRSIQRRPAHAEVLGDVSAGVAIRFHPLRGGDVLGVGDLSRPPELGAVSARCRPLEGGALLTLLALAKQVSFLNIRDPHEPVHSPRNSPGRRVRYPSVTGESEFP